MIECTDLFHHMHATMLASGLNQICAGRNLCVLDAEGYVLGSYDICGNEFMAVHDVTGVYVHFVSDQTPMIYTQGRCHRVEALTADGYLVVATTTMERQVSAEDGFGMRIILNRTGVSYN